MRLTCLHISRMYYSVNCSFVSLYLSTWHTLSIYTHIHISTYIHIQLYRCPAPFSWLLFATFAYLLGIAAQPLQKRAAQRATPALPFFGVLYFMLFYFFSSCFLLLRCYFRLLGFFFFFFLGLNLCRQCEKSIELALFFLTAKMSPPPTQRQQQQQRNHIKFVTASKKDLKRVGWGWLL